MDDPFEDDGSSNPYSASDEAAYTNPFETKQPERESESKVLQDEPLEEDEEEAHEPVKIHASPEPEPTPKEPPIIVRMPEIRGTNLLNKHHEYQIQSTQNGVPKFVFRRYADFDWLHACLEKLFPGIFIPPLPPKRILGSQGDTFVAERRIALQRFLNRSNNTVYIRASAPFKLFLNDESTGFPVSSVDMFKSINAESNKDVIARYKETFPEIIDAVGASEMGMDAVQLKDFLEHVESKLYAVLVTADAITVDLCEMVTTTGRINTTLEEVYATERLSHFPQLPTRVDLRAQFAAWHEATKKQADTYYQRLAMPFQVELWDCRAFLAAVNARNKILTLSVKAVQNSNKWRSSDADTNHIPQKTTDFEAESELKELLSLVSTMLLGFQLKNFWEHRMRAFRESLKVLASEELKLSRESIVLWQAIRDQAGNAKTA
jgi:hypothetical protein